MVIGIVLLIIGAGGIAFSIAGTGDVMMGLPDPENDALKTVNLDGTESKTVTLEEGEYEIWAEEGDNVGPLDVTDEEGNSVFERSVGENITIDRPGSDERSYEKVGDLDINEEGNYTFETNQSCTLYVNENQPVFDFLGSVVILILVILISTVVLLSGIGLLIYSYVKKDECPYCGETILEDSSVCEYCNRDLTQSKYGPQDVNRYR